MLRLLSAGFFILTLSCGTCYWSCDSETVSLNDVDTLVGKTDPKFKCAELCTDPINQCVSSGVTCMANNVGAACGSYHVSKKSLKECVEDPAGGVDPCTNDTADKCYRSKTCVCIKGLVGTTVVYGCAVPNGAKIIDSGDVTKSSNC